MDEKIQSLEANLTIISKELTELKESIVAGFKKVNNNFSVIENRLNQLENKINDVEHKVDNLGGHVDHLGGDTVKGFNELGTKIESLTEEIQKIGLVTNYDQMYKNQSDLN